MSYYLNPWSQRDISIIVRGFNTQIEFWIEISFPKNAIEAIKQANFDLSGKEKHFRKWMLVKEYEGGLNALDSECIKRLKQILLEKWK